MQTFLAYADVQKSLDCLNKQRLLKQVVEAKQIINIVDGVNQTKGWVNHPAVRMYKGYRKFLYYYYNSAWISARKRGINFKKLHCVETPLTIEYPWWFGDEKFHESHRANLWRKAYDDANGVKRDGTRKKPDFSQFDILVERKVEQPKNFYNMDYVWPV